MEINRCNRVELLVEEHELDDIEEAKAWAAEKGIKVIYEYRKQICLDPEHFYGYTVTLTEPTS
ncbi:MAG: hypothetical protein JWN67_4630 [Actinomycetia bacterium]|nr:hypothetical protein [Actinomycetes bacterium]